MQRQNREGLDSGRKGLHPRVGSQAGSHSLLREEPFGQSVGCSARVEEDRVAAQLKTTACLSR